VGVEGEMICTEKKVVITLLISLVIGLSLRIGVSTAQNFEALKIPAESLARKFRRRNPAFAISVESVLQKLREKQEIILIDVRNRSEFGKFRIPGSMNIPLFAIKTKAFLKPKSLVLVNEGYSYSQLEKECEHLRRSGFKAWLLNGGLNYWRQKGAPLKGDPFVQKALNRIPPRVFFAEKDYEDWIVIDISAPKQSQAHSLIPRSVSLPYLNDAEQFISGFKNIMAQSRDNPYLSVLLFSEKGDYYNTIENVVKKTDCRPVFFLKGGIEAYKRFLGQQALMRQARGQSKKTLKGCAGCR